MAIGAYHSIVGAGLAIPGDISVVGHDNTDLAGMVIPRLTTVDTFKFQLGQEGVKLLLEEIDKKAQEPILRVFPTKLIVRDSARNM
jgi:DNA-binding LacI/PurR family transcriptional regulator